MRQKLGVYIHWPFCLHKCPYCDFNSHVAHKPIQESEWLEIYKDHIRYFVELIDQSKYTVESIFFGGGTPSLMLPSTVEAIIQEVHNLLNTSSNIEITLECNPTSAEASKLEEFKEAGINRLSIGVQALNNEDLKWLGRQHSAETAVQTIKAGSKLFNNYSFDLIYGRRNQTPEQWQEELKYAIQMSNGHISAYSLTLEEGTKFTKLHNVGRLEIPSIDIYEDMYDITYKMLTEAGLTRYEVSNYSSNGQECRHNMLYWQSDDYIGIGAGAHGRITVGNKRQATFSTKNPYQWLTQREKAIQITQITQEEQWKEVVLMGVRIGKGINLKDIKQRMQIDLLSYLSNPVIQSLKGQGLINLTDTYLTPTQYGLNFADHITKTILLKND